MSVDEMSQTLGRLEAVADELREQCRALFGKTDESTAQLHGVAATVERLSVDVRDLRHEVSELRRSKDRGAGFLAALTLAGGGVGAGAAKLLGLIGGTGH